MLILSECSRGIVVVKILCLWQAVCAYLLRKDTYLTVVKAQGHDTCIGSALVKALLAVSHEDVWQQLNLVYLVTGSRDSKFGLRFLYYFILLGTERNPFKNPSKSLYHNIQEHPTRFNPVKDPPL